MLLAFESTVLNQGISEDLSLQELGQSLGVWVEGIGFRIQGLPFRV